ncbi:MAG: hypothetical protein JW731_05745 [Bacteroidales bacterium]|nr:hypothetical protein [Bacteroidales bacterium]
MNLSIATQRMNVRSIVIDIFALSFIYLIPTFSHLLSIPLYLVEPMRIMLILAIAHTNKRNAYLLALTLPLFSFVVSAHPNIFKAMIMTVELLFNVWLFYYLTQKVRNQFVAMIGSIILSKVLYYLLKFILISLLILDTGLLATPIYIQVITTLVFSGYIFMIFRRREIVQKN